jgi:hypothetical protein
MNMNEQEETVSQPVEITDLEDTTVKLEKLEHKLVLAAYEQEILPVWGSYGGYSSTMNPDRMKVTDGWEKQLALCRFFAKYDPVASGAINKQIELAFNGFRPKRGQCSDEEYAVYAQLKETVLQGLKILAREYLVSGLVVPEVTWVQKTGKELNLKSRPNKRYWLPETMWARNPSTITLKRSPIPTRVRVFLKVPPEDIQFINNNGVYSDGTKDPELYKQLVHDYPEYVKMVKSGKTEIWLQDAYTIRRNVGSDELYPTPYLLPALESLQHKRNLKKMDYSIAARVISAIQTVTLGSDKFPLTEDDQPLLEELRRQMLWRSQPENIERVFQIFSNHTLKIEWIHPDTKAMLDSSKYTAVNNDILYALGIPGIITSGETTKSATSQAEFALLPPTEVMRNLREELLPFIDYLFGKVMEKNGFQHKATPSMPPIKLYDPAKLATMGETYYNNGALSKTTWDDLAGFDFENELINRAEEEDLYKEYGIEPTPQVPFSSPSIGGGGNPSSDTPADPGQNEGNKTPKPVVKKAVKPAQ